MKTESKEIVLKEVSAKRFSENVKVDIMHAAVISKPGKIDFVEIPIPEPKENEIRVKLKGCGICASNIPVWEGRDWFNYPLEPGVPGHEGWGIVDFVGKNVKSIKYGDHVAIISNKAFAEYDIVPAENAVKIPKALHDHPFPAEPIGCAYNVYRRSNIKHGQTVAIIGIGFLGALLTQLISKNGLKVIAISQRDFSLETAKIYGASVTIKMDDHWKVIEAVKTLTNGHFCDVVIEATGKQWPLDLATELTKIRGRLVIAGYHQDGLRQVNMQLWNWRGIDVINAHERDPNIYVEGISEAIKLIRDDKLDPFHLIREYNFSELQQALNDTKERPDNFMKGVVII